MKFKQFTIYAFSKELALLTNQGLGTFFEARRAVFFISSYLIFKFFFHIFQNIFHFLDGNMSKITSSNAKRTGMQFT